MVIKRSVILLLTSAVLFSGLLAPEKIAFASEPGNDRFPGFIVYSSPDLLRFEEMVEASKSVEPPSSIIPRLEAILATPIISNEAYLAGVQPRLAISDKLGAFIRVGQWNIQRGDNIEEIKMALGSPDQFLAKIKAEPGTPAYRQAQEQLLVLRSTDVLVLNEVDLGVKRTGYQDIARELAQALNMNYAYGVEFIEIDPLNLGTEQFRGEDSKEKRAEMRRAIEVKPDLYRGLHGTAVLSRFPIKRAELVPLKYKPYDWSSQERERISIAEVARRRIGRVAFLENKPREIRLGGRSLLIAELEVPQLPEGSLTIAATHLENRCGAQERREQLKEALSLIKEIRGPVVLAGDLNTSGSNLKPTSVKKEIVRRLKDKAFWTKRAIKMALPLGFAFDFLLTAATFTHTVHDPTSKGIFILGPNKEKGLFNDLERMRFADGFAFDFRGNAGRTINGTTGTLANSNQRSRKKGFITTHAMERTYWAVGKNKLDWILVKAYARDPRGEGEPYRMAPHFARTLEKINYAAGKRLSDHNPITVDLPVEEPDARKFGRP
jgi:endonuclease/exonuclease/phosphatase family metal-dependent hydrolase